MTSRLPRVYNLAPGGHFLDELGHALHPWAGAYHLVPWGFKRHAGDVLMQANIFHAQAAHFHGAAQYL